MLWLTASCFVLIIHWLSQALFKQKLQHFHLSRSVQCEDLILHSMAWGESVWLVGQVLLEEGIMSTCFPYADRFSRCGTIPTDVTTIVVVQRVEQKQGDNPVNGWCSVPTTGSGPNRQSPLQPLAARLQKILFSAWKCHGRHLLSAQVVFDRRPTLEQVECALYTCVFTLDHALYSSFALRATFRQTSSQMCFIILSPAQYLIFYLSGFKKALLGVAGFCGTSDCYLISTEEEALWSI